MPSGWRSASATARVAAALDDVAGVWRGVIADVARETGRSRKQVYRWIEEHALDVASYRHRSGVQVRQGIRGDGHAESERADKRAAP